MTQIVILNYYGSTFTVTIVTNDAINFHFNVVTNDAINFHSEYRH